MDRLKRILLVTVVALVAVMLLGAKPAPDTVLVTNLVTDHAVRTSAMDWSPDMGEIVKTERLYSADWDAHVWRVEGTSTAVVMDEDHDLLELEFLD